mmetsp:Transcript_4534/g.14693  ORF Transcript_4534/g.14693 Transcript_4534/m.14693 type:complete len:212 (+) Transcript_4534:243-878(+)
MPPWSTATCGYRMDNDSLDAKEMASPPSAPSSSTTTMGVPRAASRRATARSSNFVTSNRKAPGIADAANASSDRTSTTAKASRAGAAMTSAAAMCGAALALLMQEEERMEVGVDEKSSRACETRCGTGSAGSDEKRRMSPLKSAARMEVRSDRTIATATQRAKPPPPPPLDGPAIMASMSGPMSSTGKTCVNDVRNHGMAYRSGANWVDEK